LTEHQTENASSPLTRKEQFQVQERHQVKILAIDDGIPSKTATSTLTAIVHINDNAPTFLKDYRPVITEHVAPKKVIR